MSNNMYDPKHNTSGDSTLGKIEFRPHDDSGDTGAALRKQLQNQQNVFAQPVLPAKAHHPQFILGAISEIFAIMESATPIGLPIYTNRLRELFNELERSLKETTR